MGGQADFKGNDTIKFLSHALNYDMGNTWSIFPGLTKTRPKNFNVIKIVSNDNVNDMYYCDVEELNTVKGILVSDIKLHQQSSTGLNVGNVFSDTFSFSVSDKVHTNETKTLFKNIKNMKECSFGVNRFFELVGQNKESFTIDFSSNTFKWDTTNDAYTISFEKINWGYVRNGKFTAASTQVKYNPSHPCIMVKNNSIYRKLYIAEMQHMREHKNEQEFFNDVDTYITDSYGFDPPIGADIFVTANIQVNKVGTDPIWIYVGFLIKNTQNEVSIKTFPFTINSWTYGEDNDVLPLIFSKGNVNAQRFRFYGSLTYPFFPQTVTQDNNKVSITTVDTLRHILNQEKSATIDLEIINNSNLSGNYTRYNSALNGLYNIQGYMLSIDQYNYTSTYRRRTFKDSYDTIDGRSVNLASFNSAYPLHNKGMKCLAFTPLGRHTTDRTSSTQVWYDDAEITNYRNNNKPICFRNWLSDKIADYGHFDRLTEKRGVDDFYINGHAVRETIAEYDSESNPVYLSDLRIMYLDEGELSPSLTDSSMTYTSKNLNESGINNGVQRFFGGHGASASDEAQPINNTEYQLKSDMKHCIATSIYSDTSYARNKEGFRSATSNDLFFYQPLTSEEILKRICIQYFCNVRLDWENLNTDGKCTLSFETPVNEWFYKTQGSSTVLPPLSARRFTIHNLSVPTFSGAQTRIGTTQQNTEVINGKLATSYVVANGTTSYDKKLVEGAGGQYCDNVEVKAETSFINKYQQEYIRANIAISNTKPKRYYPVQHTFLAIDNDNPIMVDTSQTDWLKEAEGLKIQLGSNIIYDITDNSTLSQLPQFYDVHPDFTLENSGQTYNLIVSKVTDITYELGLDCKVTLAPTKIVEKTNKSIDEAIFNASQSCKQYVDSQIQSGMNTGALTVLDSNGIRLKKNANESSLFGEINSTSATLPATNINGNTQVTGTFKATGTSTLQTVEATDIAGSGTLTMTGASTLNGGLTVSGNSTLGSLSCGNITSSGGASIRQTFITNGQSQMNGPVSMGSTLGVDGATVLRSGVETSWGTNAYYHEITQPSGSDAYKLKVIPLTNGFCQIAGWVHSSSQTTAGVRTIKLPFTVNTIVNVNFTPSWTPGGGRQSYIPNYNITTDYYTGAEKDSFPYKFFLDGSLSAEQCYFYFSIMCKVT